MMRRCLRMQPPGTLVIAAGLSLLTVYGARSMHIRVKGPNRVDWAMIGLLVVQDNILRTADCAICVPLLDTAVARDMRGMLRERYPSSAWVKAVSEYAGDQPGPSAGDRWLGSPAPFIRVWQSWLGYWQPADAAFRDDHAAPDDHLGLSGDQQRIAAAFARASAPAPPSADHSSLPALAAAPSPHAAAAVMPSPPAAAASTSAASAAAGSQPRPSLPGARRPAGSEQDAEADEFSLQDADGQRREGGAGRWKDEDERRRRREARWQVQRAREAGTAAAQPPPASAGARPHPPAPPPFTAAARPDRPDRSRPPRVRRNEFGDEIVEDE